MKNKYIKTLFMAAAMTCALPALAQTKVVKGTVVDEKGIPVIGATINVGGAKIATVTDLDGNYTLHDVPENATIHVSYLGYKPTTTKGGLLKLQEDASELNEVVVVGYGVQKKAHLTGSVASVKMDEVQDLASGDMASTLRGLVNGMSINGGSARPGENATISIRNASTLGDIGTTAQQPLFVIDGYIYPNDVKVGNTYQNLGAEAFNNLDASEIESISVLKDASAAVYGARAANGVILVTTKKGKLGSPRISYSGQFGFTDEVARPKMLSAYNYGRLVNAMQAADPTNTSLNKTTGLYQADELEAMKALNYDLLDDQWETAFTQKHSVNVSGATDNVSYFAGMAYYDQDGNLGKLDYNRWNYRAGIDVKISKWLSAGLTVNGDYGKKKTPLVKVGGTSSEKDYNLLLTHPRYMPEYVTGLDANGNEMQYAVPAFGISNSLNNQNQYYNYSVLQNNGDYKENMSSNMNIGANLSYDFGWSKILKGLKLKFSYAKSINTDKGNEYGSAYTLYKMNTLYGSGGHLYTPLAGDALFAYDNFTALTLGNGNYIARSMVRTDNYQMNFTASYNRKFGLHDVGALFSIEKSEAENEYLTGQREEPYPFTTKQYNSATGEMTTTFTRSESGTLSYIGRLNYSYADKYLAEVLLRSEASTKFAPKNYWGTFTSFSAGWVMSEEKWFKKSLPWVDFLKLRTSFGLTGRDNTAAWQWMQVYGQDANRGTVFGEGVSNDSGNRITINKNNSAVNSDVHWDKSYKFDFGIDAHFLDQRLSLTFDAYRQWDREMLLNLSQQVSYTIGTQSAAVNRGEIDSWGYEVSLKWQDKIGKDFKYNVGINTGYSDNKVLNMDFEDEYIYRQIQRGHRTDIGTWGMQCIGMFRSFQDINEYFDELKSHAAAGVTPTYMGLTQDKVRPGMLIYKDVRGAYDPATKTYGEADGIVDAENDQVQLGCRNNIYGFTLNAGCSYKSLSLNFQFGANWGGYTTVPSQALKPTGSIEYCNMPSFWNVDNMYSYQDVYDGSGNLVVAENRDAKYPNLAYSSVNSVASSFWRISSARVTLNRVTLAYALPNQWFKGIGVSGVRVNVTGQNLINFYNPYPDNFTSPMAGTYGSYPNLRKWTVGVNFSF